MKKEPQRAKLNCGKITKIALSG